MDEYISRESVIKKIAEVQDKATTGAEDVAYYRAIKIIRDMPSADVQPVDRWISVEDRLPEYDKIVLVWYSYDGIWGKTAGYGISWYHGKWNINELNQTGDNLEVLYWMYAPEPPKDGDVE